MLLAKDLLAEFFDFCAVPRKRICVFALVNFRFPALQRCGNALQFLVDGPGIWNIRRFPAQFLMPGIEICQLILQVRTVKSERFSMLQHLDPRGGFFERFFLFPQQGRLFLRLLREQINLALDVDQVVLMIRLFRAKLLGIGFWGEEILLCQQAPIIFTQSLQDFFAGDFR